MSKFYSQQLPVCKVIPPSGYGSRKSAWLSSALMGWLTLCLAAILGWAIALPAQADQCSEGTVTSTGPARCHCVASPETISNTEQATPPGVLDAETVKLSDPTEATCGYPGFVDTKTHFLTYTSTCEDPECGDRWGVRVYTVTWTKTVISIDEKPKNPPQANFTVSPSEGQVPLTVTSDASSSTDSDGSITSYQWSTSDGQATSGQTATFKFKKEGDYTITLTVTDDQGKTDTTQQTVKVNPVNCKTLSNVTVCANSIKETPPNSKIFTAKGNVKLAKADGNKVLSVGTDVKLDTVANTVETLGQGDITALAIKPNPNDAAKDMLLYAGGFTMNASDSPPVLSMQKDGILKLKGLPPATLDIITLNSDEVVLHRVTTNPIINLKIFLTFEDMTLSQTGSSSGQIKASLGDVLKVLPIKTSKWELGNLEFTFDVFKASITATAEFTIPGFFGSEDDGLGVTLGFLTDPFALETLGASVSADFFTLPISPPSPVGASLSKISTEIDNISSDRPLQMKITADMSLTDAALILPAIKNVIQYDVITGSVSIMFDQTQKVEISGDVNLLEKFPLGDAKISIALPNSASLEGNIDIMEILTGRLYLAISALSNFLEMTGQAGLTFHTPPKTPIIGEQLFSTSVLSTLRFNSQQIDLAEFVTHYQEGKFVDVTLRLDITDVTNPHVYVTGWGKTIQVRSANGLRAGERQVITIDKDYDTVMLVATSDQSAALFNLTLPNGTQYTPTTAPTADSPTATDIFFKRNEAAHEAYYALQKPAQGNYTVEITNATDLGNYQVELWTPSPKPTIALTSLTSDQPWDGASPLNLTWTDSDPSNQAKISLYYDTDNQGNNGSLIAADILASETSNTYQWTPSSDLQSGNYYLYAKIDDRDNMPVFAYSQGKLIVTNPKAPATPQNVKTTPGNGTITVTWTANSEPNLMGYRVYVSDTPGSGRYEHDFGIGLDTSYEIRELSNSKTYEIVVSAINEDSLESLRSSPLQQTPFGTTTQGNGTTGTTETVPAGSCGNTNETSYTVPLDRSGFYIIEATLPTDKRPGVWSLLIDSMSRAPLRSKTIGIPYAGGLHGGVVLKEKGLSSSWIGFSLAWPESVKIKATDSLKNLSSFKLEVVKQTEKGWTSVYGPVDAISEQVHSTNRLDAGFYAVVVTSKPDAPRGQLGISIDGQSLWGAVTGGWIDHTGVNYSAFFVGEPKQTADLKLLFCGSYGAGGAGEPTVQMLYQKEDGSREVYWHAK
jgi:PKD repeat protein